MPEHIPSARFSPISKVGIVLNWSLHQLIIILVSALIIIVPLMFGASTISWRTLVFLILIAVSLPKPKGRSLWQWAALRLGFAARKATGATRWSESPMAAGTTVGSIGLPGRAGKRLHSMELRSTVFRGACYLWDDTASEATVILRTVGLQWVFSDPEVKSSRARGWADAMRAVAQMPDVTRLTTQSRSLYWPHAESRPLGFNAFADTDLEEMEQENLAADMGHDVILSITVNPAKNPRLREYEGGEAGVERILKDDVLKIIKRLKRAGLDEEGVAWLTSGQIRGLMKTLVDPSATRLLSDTLSLPDDIPVCSSYAEYSRELSADRVWARSMWIDRWPQEETEAGFLEALADQSSVQMILTQVWRPIREEAAQRRLSGRKGELGRMSKVREYFGKDSNVSESEEQEGLEHNRREVNAHHAAVDFKGFITLLTYERKDLNGAQLVLEDITPTGIHYDMMVGQQWAGWLAALPIGQAGKD